MSNVDDNLRRLKKAIEQENPDLRQVADVVNDVLVWLNLNNTHENCRKVDAFVTTEIDPDMRQRLPSQLADILADMGGALHDTHTAPQIAENFYSTPEQLLRRLREFQDLQDYAAD